MCQDGGSAGELRLEYKSDSRTRMAPTGRPHGQREREKRKERGEGR